MTKLEKIIEKFLHRPTSLHYKDIEKVLLHLGFEKINVKRGSHIKFKHPHLKHDLIIPIHNNDCKDFYKKEASQEAQKVIKKQ